MLELSNGVHMPALGFGTWTLTGTACYSAVKQALELGYRHIDTSENYANEEQVAAALRDSGVPREQVFLATKLSNQSSFGGEEAVAALEGSMRRLNTTYIDLYMLHGAHPDPVRMQQTWAVLEQAQAEGKIRALGVSNFMPRDIDVMRAYAVQMPAVVQNKFSVYRPGSSFNYGGDDVLAELYAREIKLTGYSTINAWPALASPLDDLHVIDIASAHGRSPAQVLIKWALQSGVSVLTRSEKHEHIVENADVFSWQLEDAEMARLSALHWLTFAPWNRLPVHPRHHKDEL